MGGIPLMDLLGMLGDLAIIRLACGLCGPTMS